jgi:hypothetical protein
MLKGLHRLKRRGRRFESDRPASFMLDVAQWVEHEKCLFDFVAVLHLSFIRLTFAK